MILSSRLRWTFITSNIDFWPINISKIIRISISSPLPVQFENYIVHYRNKMRVFISGSETVAPEDNFALNHRPLKCMNFGFLENFSNNDPRLLILVSIPTCIYKFKQTDLMLQAIESFHNQLIIVASELLGKQFNTNSKPITTCSINLSR